MAKTCAGVNTSIIECTGGGTAGIWAIISMIINILSILVGIVAVIGITILGIQILTSKGDPGRVAKAKKRLFQVILGISVYIFLWTGTQWLLPGGLFAAPNDIESVSIEFQTGNVNVGDSVSPKVTFQPENPIDSSYTLTSEDNNIVAVNSNTIQCLRAGNATITVITVNDQKSSAQIKCINKVKPKKETYDDEDDDDDDEEEEDNGNTVVGDGSGYSDNEAVKAAYDAVGDVSTETVDNLIKQVLGISDTTVVWFAAAYEATPSWWIGNYGDYLFCYYGMATYLREVRDYGAQGEIERFYSWGYDSNTITTNAAQGKSNTMVRKMLYVTLNNPRYDIIGFCGSDDDGVAGSYGFTKAWPHLKNSDGGESRLNMLGQPIYAWLNQ